MRIAIVSDFFLDYVGGAQSSIHEQQAALEEAGHRVYLVSTARSLKGNVREVRGRGLQIKPAYVVPGVILPVVGARRKLIATLKQYFTDERIDAVHLQTEYGLAHAATTAAHELGLPVVHTIHTFYWQSSGVFPNLVYPFLKFGLENVTGVRFARKKYVPRVTDNMLRNLTMAMAERADVVVSPSAHQAEDLRAAGLERPIEVVPNPIARSPRPAAVLTAAQAEKPRIVWVARCEPEKRPLVFAEAALQALSLASFEVDFVGDGSQLDELRKLTDGAPGIRVHGNLGHDEVLQLIDDSSIGVLTSNGFDNQPMTIAESVSRYRGVLFCDPKLREGLGNSGYLSADPSAAALADAIVTLSTQPGALQALSRGALEDAVIFSAATYVERVMAAYALAGRA